uniref:Uncharacterized protein n=1 Tax=Anas zonorhyncha TaxID=75864 RepID=A0A8B9UBF9_9AVES
PASLCVAQATLPELLGSSDPAGSASQAAGTTGVRHRLGSLPLAQPFGVVLPVFRCRI